MIWYVNANAPREGNGQKETPFRWINEAAKVARPGDEVIVAPGIYRESVHPVFAGEEDNRIVYRSETPLGAEITGAELLTGWKKQGRIWTNRVKNSVFGAFNPYVEKVEGDWYFAPIVRHTGSVFLNDLAMYEAAKNRDIETVLKLQQFIMQISTSIYTVGKHGSSYLKGLKCALSMLGIINDDFVASPFYKFEAPERLKIQKALEALPLKDGKLQL